MRWILLWPILATMSVGLLALTVYVDRTARSDQIAAVDDELVRVEQRIRVAPPQGPVGLDADDLASTDVNVPLQFRIDRDGAIIETVSGANPFSAEQVHGFVGQIGNETVGATPRYRVRHTPAPDGTTMVSALSLAEVDASTNSLRSSLAVGGIVMFSIMAAIVAAVATVVTRPVTKMSQAANSIANGALDTPINAPRGSRETADLAADLDQMVQRLTSSLDDANRARDNMQRFLADASHELRTPLTSLRGYSELYARNMLSEPGHLDRAMDRVGSESTRLTDLVSDMLQLATGDAAPTNPFEPVDLVAVARDVADDLTASFPGHRIELQPPAVEPSPVNGNRGRLHQCVLNLVANACQHGGDDIDVIISNGPAAVVVSVVDLGGGIDDEIAAKVFLPFYRGDKSRTRDGHGGSGLGLALAQQIAEQHNGHITLAATPGGGATFKLTIPNDAS